MQTSGSTHLSPPIPEIFLKKISRLSCRLFGLPPCAHRGMMYPWGMTTTTPMTISHTPSSSFPRALIVRACGDAEIIDHTGLEALQSAVGGFIESIRLGMNAVMYVNEEARLRPTSEPNRFATKIVERFGAAHLLYPILGDVVLTGFDPETGEDCDFPDKGIDPSVDWEELLSGLDGIVVEPKPITVEDLARYFHGHRGCGRW